MFVTVLSLPYRCTIVNYAFFLFFFFFLRTGSPIRSEHKYFCWGKGKGQQPRKTNKIVVTKQFLVKSEYVANAIVLSLENYFSSIKHRPPCSQLLFWNKMCLLPHTSFIHPSHPSYNLQSSFQLQIFCRTLEEAYACHHSCDFNKRLNESTGTTVCLPNHLRLFTRVHSESLHLKRKLPLITSCIRL